MSKRFGRNQRRRMREALAGTQESLDASRGLAHYLNERVRELEAEMDEAKAIVGRMSHLFPAKQEFDQADREPPMKGEMFMVHVPERLDGLPACVDDQPPELTRRFRRVPLALLLAKVNRDALDHGIQVRVRFANNEVAYGITALAWHTMSSKERLFRIQKEIAPALTKLLVQTTDLRRYT